MPPTKNEQKTGALSPKKAGGEIPHVYGPVPSRRLGFSLGVDILPYKTCSFDCVYCQLGKTAQKTWRRGRFIPTYEILAQIRRAVRSGRRIDHITFSGSGEPTLNVEIGRLIREIKKVTSTPVAVLTNSSLLSRKSVRQALRAADVVVPSLDAATAAGFRRVNRPHPSIRVGNIIGGLERFRREFKGQIWLEIMLVKGVNDSPSDIQALKRVIDRINPDKVQLNTVVRPPAEKWAEPLGPKALENIKKELGGQAEVVVDFRKKTQALAARALRREILAMVERRPVTVKDMATSLGRKESEVRRELQTLLRWRRIRHCRHQGSVYYETLESSNRNNEGESHGRNQGNRRLF
jgi:wyosine [tRNA(Phe)-imidazoG37] synthetase (radical SAM superfamily)